MILNTLLSMMRVIWL